VDAPLPAAEIIRPWRTATVVASAVAAVELVLLLVAAFLLLAKPLAHAVQRQAADAAFATKTAPKAHHLAAVHRPKIGKPHLTRAHTSVVVLNGNGRAGAAGAEASRLASLGYQIRSKGNASRQDYANSVVMYRRGYTAEGYRLAHDLHVKVVGPLDGIGSSALHGAKLVMILGAR
jgi:LytR cell envelope-related transcriptional attenuator